MTRLWMLLYIIETGNTDECEASGIFFISSGSMTVSPLISPVFSVMESGETPRTRAHVLTDSGKTLRHSELLVSGAMAGALAKTVIAPFDRLKILFQTDPSRSFNLKSVWQMAQSIRSSMGIFSFWRGHTATLVRVIPYSATNFFVFDRTKNFMEIVLGSEIHPIALKFISGALSGSTAVCVTYPLETLRARLAVDLDGTRYPAGYMQAARSIMKSDGFVSLYSGLRPTLFGIVPYAGTSFAVYESLKSDDMSFQSRFAVGALAGVSAQAITYPLDVVRRRMQVRPREYQHMWNSLLRISMEEGIIRGLYKGLSMNLIKGPLAVAISLNANDHIKEFFLSRNS
jgi:solute carrier family 25 protein 42